MPVRMTLAKKKKKIYTIGEIYKYSVGTPYFVLSILNKGKLL